MYGSVFASVERALQDPPGPDAVRDVDDLHVRRDRLDHAVTRADEVVLQAEVGQERDEHGITDWRHATSAARARRGRASSPRRRRRGRRRARPASSAGRSTTTGKPRAGRGERARGGGDASEREVACGRPAAAARRCGRAAGSRRRARRRPAARPRPRRAARVRRARQLGEQPSCVATRGTRSTLEPVLRSALRWRGRSRRRGAASPRMRRASSSAPFGLVTTTQSYADGSSGSSPSGSIADQRADGRPRGRAPRAATASALRLRLRARDDDSSPLREPQQLASERPGSSPLRRSIHEPSSAAMSADERRAVVVRRDRSEAAAADRARPPRARPRRGGASRRGRPRRRDAPRRRGPAARARPAPASGSISSGSKRWPISRAEAEPVEAARGEDDRVEPALAALAQPRVDVAAQRLDRERRLEREQLRLPPHRRRADAHPGRGSPSRRTARRAGRHARDRRRPRVRPDRTTSCPSPSARRRRCGARAAPPRAP